MREKHSKIIVQTYLVFIETPVVDRNKDESGDFCEVNEREFSN